MANKQQVLDELRKEVYLINSENARLALAKEIFARLKEERKKHARLEEKND